MANEFVLEIITPRRQFLKERVISVTFSNEEGELCILASHAPIIAAVESGEIRIRTSKGVRTAICGDGFLEVRPAETIMFAEFCRWPEEDNIEILEEEHRRTEEKLFKARAVQDRVMIARMMERLQKRTGSRSSPNL